jgi:uncharacterized membrane protein
MGKKNNQDKRPTPKPAPDQVNIPAFNPTQKYPILAEMTQMTQMYTGPLPHPSILKQYDQVMPGLAERIVKMAENQSGHRMVLERASVESDFAARQKQFRLTLFGQVASFVISMTGILAGVYVAIHGKEWVGGIVGAGGIGGLVVGILQTVRRKNTGAPNPPSSAPTLQ